jgi:hypothetical protein
MKGCEEEEMKMEEGNKKKTNEKKWIKKIRICV